MTGSEIRELRRGMKLTVRGFAQLIGVNAATVTRWEVGERTPMPFLEKRLVELKNGDKGG